MKILKSFLLIFLLHSILNNTIAQKLKPGDTDPKVKVLEADAMQEFNNGAAVIQKGNAYALIDMNGDILAPYNKYDFFYALGRLNSGIFLLAPNHGAINSKGQSIASKLSPIYNHRGNVLYTVVREGYQIINSDDQRFIVKGSNGTTTGLGNFSEGMVGYSTGPSNNMKFGFKNLQDQIVIPPAYDMIGFFSDGIALVGCKNEFGEWKYGFINKEGQQVIPCIYSTMPSDFYCGRALVYPKANADFKYAYINKKGEIAIKYTQEMDQKYGNLSDGFYNGYTFNDRAIMDTSGKVYTHSQFFAKYGVSNPADKKLTLYFPRTREKWMEGDVFGFNRYDNNNTPNSGFIDLAGKKVVEGPFLNTAFYFDPVSKLAYAEIHGNDASNKTIKKGYINKQGIFVIVQKEEGNW